MQRTVYIDPGDRVLYTPAGSDIGLLATVQNVTEDKTGGDPVRYTIRINTSGRRIDVSPEQLQLVNSCV